MFKVTNKSVFIPLLLSLGFIWPIQFAVSAPLLPPLNKSNTGEQITGKFIWFEHATVDIEKQKSFYGDVFGWTFRTISKTDDQYTLIMNGGHNVAGLFSVKPGEGAKLGALWIGLMSVSDPEKAVSSVERNGGSVHTQPTTLAQRGTYALLRDPEGAVFGVLKSDSGDPPDAVVKTGDFLWVDLFAKDTAAAGKFYQQLDGYKVETSDENKGVKRVLLYASNKPRAGIVPLPKDANRAGWLPYVKVEDVTATLKKVEVAGGLIMVPPDKALLNGNLAIFSDPLGGIMGIVKWTEHEMENK